MVLENKLFGTSVSENMVWEFRFQNIRFWKTWFSKEGFVQKDDCQSHVWLLHCHQGSPQITPGAVSSSHDNDCVGHLLKLK